MDELQQATNWVHDVKARIHVTHKEFGERPCQGVDTCNIHIRHTSVSESLATSLIATQQPTLSLFISRWWDGITSSSSGDHLVQFLIKTPPPASIYPQNSIHSSFGQIDFDNQRGFNFIHISLPSPPIYYIWLYSLVYTQIIRVIN